MCKKYLVSICYKDIYNEIYSEPFGLFDNFNEAELFACEKIDNMRLELMEQFGLNPVDFDEHYDFDYTIKELSSDF